MSNVQAPRVSIDVDSDVPIVQQIVSELRRALLAGELAPGDALPSSRVLARDLGVHFNTVAQAYRELEAEGWLALKRRAGTVVRERKMPEPDPADARRLVRRFARELRDLRGRYEALGVDGDALDAELRALIENRRLQRRRRS